MDDSSIGKVILLAIGGLLGLFALIAGVWAISYGAGWVTAPWSGKLQARQQINSGDFRIAAYSEFFAECASVTTLDEALQQTLQDEKQDKGYSLSQDRTNYTGQLNSRNDAANNYNAQSQEHYTIAQFKASNLPYSIPPYVKGQVFQCVS